MCTCVRAVICSNTDEPEGHMENEISRHRKTVLCELTHGTLKTVKSGGTDNGDSQGREWEGREEKRRDVDQRL